MKFKFWQKKDQDYPLATSHEQIAGNICAQLGHLSNGAIVEILKIVIKRMLPKWALGHKPYGLNPKKDKSDNEMSQVIVTTFSRDGSSATASVIDLKDAC